MKEVTFEVRMRLPDNTTLDDEARDVLDARYKLMNAVGALSVVQIGPVDNDVHRKEIPAA